MSSNSKHLTTKDHLSAIAYDEWHRYELIEGKLYVSCAPDISHQLVLSNLQGELGKYLIQNPIGILVPSPGAVFSEYNSVIPDIVYVGHERWESIVTKDYFSAAPDLIIEVLSGASCFRDMKLKRKLYGKYGVREYWIVDGWSQSVLVFRLKNTSLESLGSEKTTHSNLRFPGLSINVGAFLTGFQDFQD